MLTGADPPFVPPCHSALIQCLIRCFFNCVFFWTCRALIIIIWEKCGPKWKQQQESTEKWQNLNKWIYRLQVVKMIHILSSSQPPHHNPTEHLRSHYESFIYPMRRSNISVQVYGRKQRLRKNYLWNYFRISETKWLNERCSISVVSQLTWGFPKNPEPCLRARVTQCCLSDARSCRLLEAYINQKSKLTWLNQIPQNTVCNVNKWKKRQTFWYQYP